ncbi:EamA family transporter [Actinoallomurus sp. NPDC052274]|uniref:EamA family transporter n=1 Tax=Actinoallomurus sp. NPDC052274 TaxID=3155420 RepID=UPI00342AE68C
MSRRWSTGLLGLWVTLTLGVPFLLISVAGRALPADVLTCVRFALAGLTLLTVMAVRRGPARAAADVAGLLCAKPGETLAVGACSAALPSVLISLGEHHVASGVTALLLAGTPIWIAVGGHVLLPAERLRPYQAACLAVALGGTALLTTGAPGGFTVWSVLPLAAAVGYAAGNLLVRGRLRHDDALTLTCAQMTVATVMAAPFAAAHLSRITWRPGPWLATVLLGVVCSGLGWLANTVLMQRVSAVRASLVSFAAPVVSVLLGAIVLGEHLSSLQSAAAGVVLAAIMAFGVLSRATARPSARREVRAILELAILGFLSEHAMHAYELRKRITVLVGHVRPVSDGSLYPALQRLRRQGLVTRRPEPGSGGPARQVFELTDEGQAELRRRLTEPDELEITDRNKYFVLLAFLHLLPSKQAQATVLRRRLEFLDDPGRGFFVHDDRVLRQDELTSPFRSGIQHIARATTSAERAWLGEMLGRMEEAPDTAS